MTSVNANLPLRMAATADTDTTPERTPDSVGTPASGVSGGISMMASSLGSTLTDAATFVGVDTNDDGSLKAGVNPVGIGGFAAVTAGPAAVAALANRVEPVTGASTTYLDRLGTTALTGTIRVTPTLVSAVAGPAIADGVTMIAPNLVKKYKDTRSITNIEDRKKAEANNQYSRISRAVAGGLVVGIAAGAVFLLKPEWFRKFGVGVTHALEGSTSFSIGGGAAQKLSGVLDDATIRATLASTGKQVANGETINILKTVSPMAKDAVFSNRLLMASAGAVGTLALANTAAGEQDPDRQKLLWGLTAAAGAATIGGTWGIGKLTQGSFHANGGTGGVLAKNQLFLKPNIEWIKKYANTIAPITAVPAGTAASQYFNIVNDFDEITSARSPFRR